MSFDVPARLERDIEEYAQDEHISPEEAALRLIGEALEARKRATAQLQGTLTDADLTAFDKYFPSLGALDDVTDEQWDKVLDASRALSREGISTHA